MAALPWFAFDLEAYTANTMHLTTEEHGAYLLLMISYYRTGKPLPGYDRALANITGLSLERWAVVKVAMEPFFIVEGTFWKHARIEEELLVASSKHAAAVAKSKAANAVRYGKAATRMPQAAPQAAPKHTRSRKTPQSMPEAKPQPAPSSAPSMPQGDPQPPHLQEHLTTTVVVVNGKHDDATTKVQDGLAGKEESFLSNDPPKPPPYNPLGTTLPATWVPGENDLAVAVSHGMTDEFQQRELEMFHALNKEKGTFSQDWSATWVKFCMRFKEREAAKPKKAPARYEVNTTPLVHETKDWEWACSMWAKGSSTWSRQMGPEPGQPNCKCPVEIMVKHGIDPATGMVQAKAKAS